MLISPLYGKPPYVLAHYPKNLTKKLNMLVFNAEGRPR